MAHEFPSLDWMQAYAEAVAAHPMAGTLSQAMAGRYRFVITPGGPVTDPHAYDLVVDGAGAFAAEVAGDAPTDLVVTADHPRWRALLTGRADFLMSYLMRKVKVDGDLGSIRSRLSDVKPLLECLQHVPTRFPS